MRRGIKSANCNSAHQPLLSASMKSRNKTDATNRASVVSETEPLCVGNQLQNIFAPTDSKLAMKLFGSKKALMKERVRQKEIGHWIIHPCSSFRCPSVNHSQSWNLNIVIQLALLGWVLTPFVWLQIFCNFPFVCFNFKELLEGFTGTCACCYCWWRTWSSCRSPSPSSTMTSRCAGSCSTVSQTPSSSSTLGSTSEQVCLANQEWCDLVAWKMKMGSKFFC